MKRFHVSVSVADIERSQKFYSTLFGVAPTVRKDDYAKWMLEDPRINFSINASAGQRGLNHVGLQADTLDELEHIRARVSETEERSVEQPDADCCYASSTKTWVRDPDSVVWEMFVTHGQIVEYGDDRDMDELAASDECCKEAERGACCI